MSEETDIAVLKEQNLNIQARLKAHSVMIEKIEDLTLQNALAVSRLVEAIGPIKKVVYGAAGAAGLALMAAMFKVILK